MATPVLLSKNRAYDRSSSELFPLHRTGPPRTLHYSSHALLLLSSITIMLAFNMLTSMLLPILPRLLADLDPACAGKCLHMRVGAMLACPVLVSLVLMPMMGRASDRYGGAVPLLCGTVTALVSCGVLAFARSTVVLLVGQIISGFASCAVFNGCYALLAARISADSGRGEAIGMALAAAGIGTALGPPVCGAIFSDFSRISVAWFRAQQAVAFLGVSPLLIISALLQLPVMFGKSATLEPASHSPPEGLWKSCLVLIGVSDLRVLWFALALCTLCGTAIGSFTVLHLTGAGMSAKYVGIAAVPEAVVYTLLTPFAGRFVLWSTPKLGLVIQTIGLVVVAMCLRFVSANLLHVAVLASVAWSFGAVGMAAVDAPAMALVVQTLEERGLDSCSALALALTEVHFMIGAGFGAPLGAAMYGELSFEAALMLLALLPGVSIVPFLLR